MQKSLGWPVFVVGHLDRVDRICAMGISFLVKVLMLLISYSIYIVIGIVK